MHRSRASLSLFLSVVLFLAFVPVAPATTRAEIEASRERAEQAREAARQAEQRAEQFRGEARALDETIREITGQIRELDPQIAEATERTARLTAEVRDLVAEIGAKEAEIAKAEADYEFQQQLLNDRITASYKQGNLFFLNLLLDATTIGDLITRTALVQRVIDANNQAAVQLIHTREQLERARADLERAHAAAAEKRAEAVALEGSLRSMRSQRASALSSQETVQAQKTELMEASEADAERWNAAAEEEEAEARRLEAELRAAASRGSGEFHGGVMAWPVPGGHVTSGYGWRTHPIFHSRRFHHGIDISRGGGTVLAAGDGTVLRATYGWNGGLGNVIVIDHGDGVTTVYAHLLDGGFK
ncbi:MAG TPA: peptidoglycan DD-metalloendopeptidase family protein, partial [Coriobacteriia bacterium]|nr:peptidoglycan DD-metalloendopeptidase family protein [Coriobacteriia bacterium]